MYRKSAARHCDFSKQDREVAVRHEAAEGDKLWRHGRAGTNGKLPKRDCEARAQRRGLLQFGGPNGKFGPIRSFNPVRNML